MFDVNVVKERNINSTSLPTFTATGTELVRTVVAAAASFPRVAIYSEWTVRDQDWMPLRIALTRNSTLSGGGGDWKVAGSAPVLLTPAEDRDYYMDGRLWPAVSSDGVLAPPGRHGLSTSRPWYAFLDPGTMPARLMSISGDLLDAPRDAHRLDLPLRQPRSRRGRLQRAGRATSWSMAGTSACPSSRASLSGQPCFPPANTGWPRVTNTKAGVAVNLWGWASASAINALGGLATGLMLLIYFEVRVRRIVRRRA